jgi:hypothetical protein
LVGQSNFLFLAAWAENKNWPKSKQISFDREDSIYWGKHFILGIQVI